MKTYKDLDVNKKINFKLLLIRCGFKSLSKAVHNKQLVIDPINTIFD